MIEWAREGHSPVRIAEAFERSKGVVYYHAAGHLTNMARRRKRWRSLVAAYDAAPWGEKQNVGLAFGYGLDTNLSAIVRRMRLALARAEREARA